MQFIMGIKNNMPTLIGKAGTQYTRGGKQLKLQLSLAMKVYGCEYDDHATSVRLLCCMFDTIQIRSHTVALGNAHKPLTL